MKIKCIGTIGLAGEHYPPGAVLEVADEVAAELLEKQAAVEAADDDEITAQLPKGRRATSAEAK